MHLHRRWTWKARIATSCRSDSKTSQVPHTITCFEENSWSVTFYDTLCIVIFDMTKVSAIGEQVDSLIIVFDEHQEMTYGRRVSRAPVICLCLAPCHCIMVLEIVYSVQQGPTNAIGRDGFALFVTGHCPITLIDRICRDEADKLLY